jgi:hypothetical protein
MNLRFVAAMSCYALLAILAGFTLSGDIRLVTWVVLGGIAIRTCLVVMKRPEE